MSFLGIACSAEYAIFAKSITMTDSTWISRGFHMDSIKIINVKLSKYTFVYATNKHFYIEKTLYVNGELVYNHVFSTWNPR